MARPRLLDLYCGAGGAAVGYYCAGFDVVGVDIKPQEHYPFEFINADAFDVMDDLLLGLRITSSTYESYSLDDFSAIHASPPCQAHSSLKTSWNAKRHADLIPQTRELLKASGLPYVIENVPGAPLNALWMLCGTTFGLGTGNAELRRHRYFETTASLTLAPQCAHKTRRFTIDVYGGGHGESLHRGVKGQRNYKAAEQREAMGIDWMTVDELSQAIPPAYTEFIGKQLLVGLTEPK